MSVPYFSAMHHIMSRDRSWLLIVPVVVGLTACGLKGGLGAGSSQSATSPAASPPLATPTSGISSQFLAYIDSDGFYVEPAPSGVAPGVTQGEAESVARDYPPTHGVVNGSMLGQCVLPGRGNTPTKSYLCWLIDGTSGVPEPISHPYSSSSASPMPEYAVYKYFYVVVDAQSGSSTVGTVVFAGGGGQPTAAP